MKMRTVLVGLLNGEIDLDRAEQELSSYVDPDGSTAHASGSLASRLAIEVNLRPLDVIGTQHAVLRDVPLVSESESETGLWVISDNSHTEASALELVVPRGAPTSIIAQASPTVTVQHMRSALSIHASAGSISVVDHSDGTIAISADAGDVSLSGKIGEGVSRIATGPGAIRVALAPESNALVHARTRHGKIDMPADSVILGDAQAVVLNDPVSILRLESQAGDIIVSVS